MKINKILAIAINEYDDNELNKINNCKSDISEIIKILTDKYEFDDVDFIFDKLETTRKSLINTLNEYFVNCLVDENVLLIYAGHGQYHDILKTSYWMPSDSNPLDLSTWINIGDILSFIRASKAFHISIISDSCFSGAIFEAPTRGGGIDAFISKKSRLCLTSGSIEKVSDGIVGTLSPFASTLIKTLSDNNKDELPFSVLANKLIMNFNADRKQTPMFGPLLNVGHDGGSFIFKAKKELEKVSDRTKFLKDKMKNLFINISDEDLSTLDEIAPFTKQKIDAILDQKYEKAAKFRDQERKLEFDIYDRTSDYIEKFCNHIKFSEDDIQSALQLDKDVDTYNKKLLDISREKDEQKSIYFAPISNSRTEFSDKIKNGSIIELFGFANFSLVENPAESLFFEAKDKFVLSYNNSVINLYEDILRIKSTSKNEFLTKKAIDLKEILIQIYKYEIGLLIKGSTNSFNELITLKELDMNIINWIRK